MVERQYRLFSRRDVLGLLACIFLCGFSILVRPAAPELNQWIHQYWTTDTGLAQNSVYSLAQDRQGFLWFGSENGVARFDGASFEIFNETTRPAVPHNLVSSLVVAKDGTLWGAARTGGLFHYRNGVFEVPFPVLEKEHIWALAETADGAIWAGSENGLFRIMGSELSSFHVADGLPNEHVTTLERAASGALWIGTWNGGFARFEGGKLETIQKLPSDSPVKDIAENPKNGDVWVASDGGGLFLWRGSALRKIDLTSGEEYLNVQCVCVDREGAVWAGTQTHGVFRYVNGSISNFNEADGLTHKDVTSVFCDREGSIWIGTLFGGLNQLHPGKFATYGVRQGLPSDNVTCVIEEAPDSFWVGTRGAGLLKFEAGKSGYSFSPVSLKVTSESGEKPAVDIRAMFLEPGGTLWIGDARAGVIERARNGSIRILPIPPDTNVQVSAIMKLRNGELWVGTRDSGLLVYDAEAQRNGELSRVRTYKQPFLLTHIRCFAEDASGVLWIGTQNGLVRYENGRFQEHYLAAYPEASIRSIVAEPDGALWIATRDDGLLHFRGAKVHGFNPSTGLKHSRIYNVLRVGGDLWLAGNRGVERVAITELEAVMVGKQAEVASDLFTERDGLRTSECSAEAKPSISLANDGRIWFATRRGLAVVDPAHLPRNTIPPNVLVREVRADNFRLTRTSVPAGTRRLEIDYSALSLRHPSKVFFRHKLSGVDVHWIEAGKAREAVYYNLRPGNYKFEVRACNDDGIWSEPGATLAFTVLPHFYQTIAFRIALVLGAIGAAVRAYRWSVARMRGDNRKLEQLAAVRMRELQTEATHRRHAEEELRALNAELEGRVHERTAQLTQALEELQGELRERHEAEQALARSEARLRRIVDSGMVGILFWRKEGLISEANDTFLGMVGYSREDLEAGNVRWDVLTPEEYLPLDAAALEEIHRSGVCTPFEKEYRRKDGTRIPVLLGGASLSTDAERGVCFVLDISELKKKEEQIRILNLLLEQRVQERTLQLAQTNEQLAAEVLERKRVAVALSALSQLGQRLHSARTEVEAAGIIAETAQSLIPHHSCSISLYGPDNQLFSVIESNVANAPSPLRSSISVPIRNGTRVIGVLGVKGGDADLFNAADANTLQALGDYCGGALDRIHAETARRETDRRFSAFMANAPALAWMKDAQFRYVFANEMFYEFTGRSPGEVEGKTDFDLWPQEIAERIRQHDLRVFDTQAALETQEEAPSGGTRILLSLRFLFTTSTGERFVAGMAVDISEQKRAEEALHRLPQSIIEAQEKERRRVARELHDGVNQAIASAKFRIQTAEQQIARGDPKWQETCSKSKEMLDSVLQQVRRLSRNLRPGELDDFGLVPAIRSVCQEVEARTGIQVRFAHHGPDDRLPATLELSLYRIVQEALTNIEKHSGATAVHIGLGVDAEAAALEIWDNGRGFNTAEMTGGRRGLGLLHMRERATLVRGTFSMHTEPGTGVRICVSVPITPNMEPVGE